VSFSSGNVNNFGKTGSDSVRLVRGGS
jgi:hypothetical protein